MSELLWVFDLLQVQKVAIRDVDGLVQEDRLQDSETLKFKIRADDQKTQYLAPDLHIQYKNRRYRIVELIQKRAAGEAFVEVDCEARWTELSRRTRAGNTTLLGRTILQGLTTILAGTGWTVGGVPSIPGLFSIDELDETIVGLLRRWAQVTGTEVEWDTVNRRVFLREQVGQDLGVGFRYGHNVTEITRRYEPPVATRLYAYGANSLNIAGSNPTGLEYVENYSWYTDQGITLAQAQARYRKDQIWSDDRYLLSLNLFEAAQRRLAFLSRPTISYEMKVLDLWALTQAADPVETGDTVTVRDAEFNVDLKTRVVRVVRHPRSPWLDEVELDYLQRTLTDSELEVGTREQNYNQVSILVDTSEDPLTIGTTTTTWGEIAITVAGETTFVAGGTLIGTTSGTGTVEVLMAVDGIPTGATYEFTFGSGEQFEFSWPTFATGIGEGSYLVTWRARVVSGAGTIAVTEGEARAWLMLRGAVGVGISSSPNQQVSDAVEWADPLDVADDVTVTIITEQVFNPEETAPYGAQLVPGDAILDLSYFRLNNPTYGILDGPGVLAPPEKAY